MRPPWASDVKEISATPVTANVSDGASSRSGMAPFSRAPIRVITTGSSPMISAVGAGPAR